MKTNYQKLYMAFEPDLADLKTKHIEFAHPEIRLGRCYGERGQHYWESTAEVRFQVTVSPTDEYQDTRAYAGYLNVKLDKQVDASKVIAKAQTKAYELAPNEQDEYQRLLIGLRAMGYRQAHLSKTSSEVVSTW